MKGYDLKIEMVVTAVRQLVLDPHVGEVHLLVEVGQVVLERPRMDL